MVPQPCIKWLKSYSLTNAEIDYLNLYWSSSTSLLIFPQFDGTTIIGYTGRRFEGEGSKYVIKGVKTRFKRIYGSGSRLVYTEDIISALKVGRVASAMPLFGSSIPEMTGGYKEYILWLDKDKQSSSVIQCRKWKQYGYNIRPVITDKDPKEYSTEEIERIL